LFLGPVVTGKSHLAQPSAGRPSCKATSDLSRPTSCWKNSLMATLTDARRNIWSRFPLSPYHHRRLRHANCRKQPPKICWKSSMRRYERASTLLTSNRPVDDWGNYWPTLPPSAPCWTGCCIMPCAEIGPRAGAPRPRGIEKTKREECFDQSEALPSRTRDFNAFAARMAADGAACRAHAFGPGTALRRIPAEPYPRPGAASINRDRSRVAKNICQRRCWRGITTFVLPQFRWPVLRCPSLAGFQASPRGRQEGGSPH